MNRLGSETSPYLRQHADNPVHWYPWGDEAFAEARERDVPVLLSVGYSACHWCHVMAHESFEDEQVAAAMNAGFVNVKVDREERPDVDAIYMEAVQAVTGRGGWPMTVVMTPDGRPFFGGTYFPKPSFLELLRRIGEAWHQRRDAVDDDAGRLTELLGRFASLRPDDEAGLPTSEDVDAAVDALTQEYDAEWGGFGRAPKFPQTMSLELCLQASARRPELLEVVTTSLDAMASGGMWDHLGGGFARYSTDAFWMVPHFEKMLYDQALLARSYLHAWQVTGEARYRQVLDETCAYVLRDLRHERGGFFSAEDADSEGEEGLFYVWRTGELREVLGADLAAEAITWWGLTEGGNFEGANILHRPVRGDLLRPPSIEEARRRLFEARETRVRPGLDDKVLTEWNALMLSTLSDAAAATGERAWLEAAVATGEFLLAELRRPDGRWLRAWQAEAGARHLAYAADHAALVDAFVRLAEATGQARWIREARTTADALLELFWDPEGGGLFTTGSDAAALVTRPKDLLDNATPSANSLAALALQRLAALTGELRYRDHADAILRLLARPATQHPSAFAHLLAAASLRAAGPTEVAVVGDGPEVDAMVGEVHRRYLPGVVLAWGEPYDSPLWEQREPGRAYVCRQWACQAPVADAAALAAQL